MTRARTRTRRGTRNGEPAAEIDWVAVRRRLAAAAIRDHDALTTEQADAILARRARALAAAVEPEVERSAGSDMVVMRIADERYALAAAHVWRVVGASD